MKIASITVHRSLTSALAVAAACGAFAAPSSALTPLAKLVKVGSFAAPTGVVQPPGSPDTLWVIQKRGQISVVKGGRLQSGLALDISGSVSFDVEQGLLGVAFAPDYETSHLAYVTYTAPDRSLNLVEYHGDAAALDPSTKRTVLSIAKPQTDHNGGTIHFGPDGYLYLGTGDGGGPGDMHGTIGNAQDQSSLLGKMLRINPRKSGDSAYTVPSDNPFMAVPAARPEIWAYGLRNPWKWSFAPDGAMWIGDVGQDTYEEIDRVTAGGANFGWRIVEGPRLRQGKTVPAGLTAPIVSYRHGPTNGCSIIGGVTVADSSIPKLLGRYLYGDFCLGQLKSLAWNGAVAGNSVTGITVPGKLLTSIDTDLAGKVYISTLGSGTAADGGVWRLAKR